MQKNIILSVIAVIGMALLLLNSQAALDGARNGLLLWYRTLFPTLMPFMVLSNFIVLTGAARSIGRILSPVTSFLRLPQSAGYCILVGLLCGYPMGAYVCSGLNAAGELSDKDMDYLAPVCNNVSPMFMVSYISIGCLGSAALIPYVVAVLVGGTLSAMVLLRLPAMKRKGQNRTSPDNSKNRTDIPIRLSTTQALNRSINNTITASLKLCIFVMLFSVIGSLIARISVLSPTTKAGLMSLCEITAGLNQFAIIDVPFKTKFLFITAFTAFGGLSSVFQTMSLASDSHFHAGKYIANKFIISVITCLLAMLTEKLLLPGGP